MIVLGGRDMDELEKKPDAPQESCGKEAGTKKRL